MYTGPSPAHLCIFMQAPELAAGPTSFICAILARAVPTIAAGKLGAELHSFAHLGLQPTEYALLKAIYTNTVPSGPGRDAKTGPLESPGGGEAAAVVTAAIKEAFRPHEARYCTRSYPYAPFLK